MRGQALPQFGGLAVLGSWEGASMNGAGVYPIWVMVTGGQFKEAILLYFSQR